MKRCGFVRAKGFIAFFMMFAAVCFADDLKNHVALNQLVLEIRNPQTDLKNFRGSLEKIGEYLALEALKELDTKEETIETLTGAIASHSVCAESPVLVTILRAGVPLCQGVQKIFPNSEMGFLGMARNEETLKAQTDYVAIPEVTGKCVIITDTMIATGGSMIDAIKIIEGHGPKKIIVIGAIAAENGIARIREYNPQIKIIAAAIDPKLNEKGYIIPGLGDAGDRSYGRKL